MEQTSEPVVSKINNQVIVNANQIEPVDFYTMFDKRMLRTEEVRIGGYIRAWNGIGLKICSK